MNTKDRGCVRARVYKMIEMTQNNKNLHFKNDIKKEINLMRN